MQKSEDIEKHKNIKPRNKFEDPENLKMNIEFISSETLLTFCAVTKFFKLSI